MKWRIRKKAFDCSHHVYEQFLVTDDPYPIYNNEDFCKLGKFDNTWVAPDKKVSLCENCKKFCVSRPMIMKQREEKRHMKEIQREWKKAERVAFKSGTLQKDFELERLVFNFEELPF